MIYVTGHRNPWRDFPLSVEGLDNHAHVRDQPERLARAIAHVRAIADTGASSAASARRSPA